MLLSAAPLLQTPLGEGAAGRRTPEGRRAAQRPHGAPPRSGPVGSQRLPVNLELTILSRPPRAKIRRRRRRRRLPGGVAVREDEVLHRQPRRGLVVAVRRGPGLRLVAGVLVPDAALAAAADVTAAAVEDDAAADVDHLRGPGHRDPDRLGPQRKLIIPPFATARTTARDVQLRGVPLPTPHRDGRCRRPAPRARLESAAAPGAAVRARQRMVRTSSRRIALSYNRMVVARLCRGRRSTACSTRWRTARAATSSTAASQGEPSVSRLADGYPMSFAAVQKHVAVLERAGLVTKERRGREQLVHTDGDAVGRARRVARRARGGLARTRGPDGRTAARPEPTRTGRPRGRGR